MNVTLKRRLIQIEKAVEATQRAIERDAEIHDELRRQMKLTDEDRELLRQADKARARGECPAWTPELERAHRHLGHDFRLRLKAARDTREIKSRPARGHKDGPVPPEDIVSILHRGRDRQRRSELSEV